jgi:hypothetical protein
MSRDVLEEKPAFRLLARAARGPVAARSAGEAHRRTNGRTRRRADAVALRLPGEEARVPPRSSLVAVQWLSPQMMELAREAEVAIGRDGVYLIGDDREPTRKARTSGLG